MSDTKLVSPLLDGFVMGDPMSSHDGVRCCPAMKENSDEKYIVKIISVPASQKQLDALLLTGAYKDAAAAMEYFKELSDGIVKEAETLQQLAKLEGFLPYDGWQVVPMGDNKLGYEIYLVGSYKRSLEKFLRRNPMTHLGAVNLGLDLCAALAICRRAGYLFVDLKPSNIFLTGEREYRIGDLGFTNLKTLKYNGLPNKYRSPYTAPELHDALATLNPTADTYAVGLILYQIYNNGQLPFRDKAPAQELPAPLNADYEMAEIIMKAISPDPRTRWQNPIEMGQALVSYMQRNIVNDNPIVPPVVSQSAPVAAEQPVGEEDDLLAGNPAAAEEASVDSAEDMASEEAVAETDAEDSSGQLPDELAFLNDMISDETAPSTESGDDLADAEMSDEVSSMLAQADELLSQEEIEEVAESEIPDAVPDVVETGDKDDYDDYDDDEDDEEDERPDYNGDFDKPRKKGHSWVAAIAIILVLALLGGGGFYFYQNYYLMEIDKMSINEEENTLTVEVVTSVDESLLRVVCTDTYGNTLSQPVSGGTAVFTDLTPATTYKVTVEVEGFHALTGSYSGSYTTQEQTDIVSFTAITGTEDGSVILNFTVDGRETQDWMINYSTEGEEKQSVSFTGHMVTINDLTVGKTYTFQLVAAPGTELYITGNDTLEFTASKIIVAEDLRIVSCVEGVLTAQWEAPEDSTVESWTVRCYSDDGYDETITVTEATAQFSDISTEKAYTVEVTAAGMAQSARAYVTANPATVSNIQVEPTDEGGLTVTWEHSGESPEGGWLLMYSVDNGDYQAVLICTENACAIEQAVPGATYNLSIQAADGSTVFGGLLDYTTEETEEFDDHSLSASEIQASLCLTPDKDEWTHEDLNSETDYTTSFSAEQKASMVLYASSKFKTPKDDTTIMYVIRNADGNILGELINVETATWASMWTERYAYLDIPAMPTEAGSYSIEIYFNSALVTTKNFTITG